MSKRRKQKVLRTYLSNHPDDRSIEKFVAAMRTGGHSDSDSSRKMQYLGLLALLGVDPRQHIDTLFPDSAPLARESASNIQELFMWQEIARRRDSLVLPSRPSAVTRENELMESADRNLADVFVPQSPGAPANDESNTFAPSKSQTPIGSGFKSKWKTMAASRTFDQVK